MRPALLPWAALAAALSVVSAKPAPVEVLKGGDDGATTDTTEALSAAAATPRAASAAALGDTTGVTVFNGIEVPPLKEIKGDNFEDTIRDGVWWIKFYSPYCGHCQAVAPVWQTLYEFYYTSDPLHGRTKGDRPDLTSPNSFHGYYNFHFAAVNCVAYGDLCQAQGVTAWPAFYLYKKGEFVEKYTGPKSIEGLSSYVEDILERIKPGSRDREGISVPQPGATVSPGHPQAAAPLVEEPGSKAAAPLGEGLGSKAAAPLGDGPGSKAAAPLGEVPGSKAGAALAAAAAAAAADPRSDKADTVNKGDRVDKAEAPAAKAPAAKQAPVAQQAALAEQADAKAGEKPDGLALAVPELESETATALLSSETARNGRTRQPADPDLLPNPQGISVPLNAESFQHLVTNSQDSWFIKFYVPWCPHCQHLAPTWNELAREMEGRLNIGEVNCEESARLCKDAKVSAYPTIYFFRGGERVEYNGLRGLGDLISFAGKALDSDVKYVDAAGFKDMEEIEEVIFVYFFDHATTSEDFLALDRLTLSLIGHAKIVKTDSEALATRFKISTWPRLLVSRDGRPSYYNALAPKDMRDFRKVLTWMQSVWRPLVPELTASNGKDIMNGKFVVLGILNRESPDEFAQSRRELKNAALEWMDKQTQLFQLERQELRDSKQLRIEEAEDRNDQRALRQAKSIVISITEDDFRKPVNFAWVDGIFWERWLRSTYGIDVSKGERVIINDEDNRRYWDQTDSGAFIVPSRTSILETLPRVVSNPPRLTPKSTIGTFEHIIFSIRNFGTYHPYLSFAVLIVLVIGLFFVLRNGPTIKKSLSRSGSGYFRLDGKDGLLGVANGKAD